MQRRTDQNVKDMRQTGSDVCHVVKASDALINQMWPFNFQLVIIMANNHKYKKKECLEKI